MEQTEREKEIVKKLSEMHKNHTTDPWILCAVAFHEFDPQHTYIAEYTVLQLQEELFEICHTRGDKWTR